MFFLGQSSDFLKSSFQWRNGSASFLFWLRLIVRADQKGSGNVQRFGTRPHDFAGSRLLSTQTWNGSSETTEFHHPDRLGTKLVTNDAANTYYEQSTLPFGTSLESEFIGTPNTNQRFTTYDRSTVASLDYAVNRSYSPAQGRFTQVEVVKWNRTQNSCCSFDF